MKNNNVIKDTIKIFLAFALIFNLSCERDLTDDAVEAVFPSTAEVFTDAPVGLTDQFFESFDPAGGANPNGFGTDDTEAFEGTTSIRIDVPAPNDPDGGFIGGLFRDRGAGRNLTGFDALTFWAKGSTTASVGLFGFGTDFIGDRHAVGINNVALSTDWRKYIVPIPDPSKLTQEQGMFVFSAGTDSTGGLGYTIWIDEIRFENLGTIAQPRPAILNGQDQFQQTFIGAATTIGGLTQTFNLPTGNDITVTAAPAYFDFTSSNSGVASADEFGQVSINQAGTATITASLNGIDAEGSLTLESLGEFEAAPTPPARDPANVISLFSDAYTNVPVDYYNGFFNGDGQTTQGGAPPIVINNDAVINYTDLNFVGIGTFLNVAPLDATQMTHVHVDINVQEDIDPGDFLTLQILNGVQTGNETSGAVTLTSTDLVSNGWASFDIPLGQFSGLGGRDALGLFFFVSNATISNIYVDNLYYYKEVIDPTDNVDDSAATEVALPIGFESTSLTYEIGFFAGADSAVEANPDQSGINPTGNVLRSFKSAGAEFFAGTTLELDSAVDFSTSQLFRMKVWSPKSGIPVRIKLENSGNPGLFVELDANTTTSNEWEELEWDFSGTNFNIAPLDRVVIFFEFIPGVPGDGSTYYCDDLKILN